MNGSSGGRGGDGIRQWQWLGFIVVDYKENRRFSFLFECECHTPNDRTKMKQISVWEREIIILCSFECVLWCGVWVTADRLSFRLSLLVVTPPSANQHTIWNFSCIRSMSKHCYAAFHRTDSISFRTKWSDEFIDCVQSHWYRRPTDLFDWKGFSIRSRRCVYAKMKYIGPGHFHSNTQTTTMRRWERNGGNG